MTATQDALTELESMMDEGIRLELSETDSGVFRLVVRVDDGCAECLVPDATLKAIASDALQRRGVPVEELVVEHAG